MDNVRFCVFLSSLLGDWRILSLFSDFFWCERHQQCGYNGQKYWSWGTTFISWCLSQGYHITHTRQFLWQITDYDECHHNLKEEQSTFILLSILYVTWTCLTQHSNCRLCLTHKGPPVVLRLLLSKVSLVSLIVLGTRIAKAARLDQVFGDTHHHKKVHSLIFRSYFLTGPYYCDPLLSFLFHFLSGHENQITFQLTLFCILDVFGLNGHHDGESFAHLYRRTVLPSHPDRTWSRFQCRCSVRTCRLWVDNAPSTEGRSSVDHTPLGRSTTRRTQWKETRGWNAAIPVPLPLDSASSLGWSTLEENLQNTRTENVNVDVVLLTFHQCNGSCPVCFWRTIQETPKQCQGCSRFGSVGHKPNWERYDSICLWIPKTSVCEVLKP